MLLAGQEHRFSALRNRSGLSAKYSGFGSDERRSCSYGTLTANQAQSSALFAGAYSRHPISAEVLIPHQGLKVIFTSGYSVELADQEVELHEGQNFLQKPFPRSHLFETIRRCLDG